MAQPKKKKKKIKRKKELNEKGQRGEKKSHNFYGVTYSIQFLLKQGELATQKGKMKF